VTKSISEKERQRLQAQLEIRLEGREEKVENLQLQPTLGEEGGKKGSHQMSSSTTSLQLEESLFKNLESRGVVDKVEGCILALTLDYISETRPKSTPPPPTQLRREPDDILCFALIADYLREVAPSALAVFEVETGISSSFAFPSNNTTTGDATGFGAIVSASIAQKIIKKGISSATAPLGGISPIPDSLAFERTRKTPGLLERKIVESELGLDEDSELDSTEKESPLLLMLIKRARERRISRATAKGSWLANLKNTDIKIGNQRAEKDDDDDDDSDFPGSAPIRSHQKTTIKSSSYNSLAKQPITIIN